MNSNNVDSDIIDSGTIKSLLHYGFTLASAIIEAIDNALDAKGRKFKVKFDKKNSMAYFISDGNGANKKALKRFSRLNDSVPASTERHGLYCAGAKYMMGYMTNLFLDDDKKELRSDVADIYNKSNKTCMEILKTSIVAISKCDDYDEVSETDINQIIIDFIKPLKGGKYKNEAEQVIPLHKKIWETFAIDPEQPGFILCCPLDEKVCKEFIEKLTATNIKNSLPVLLGTTYCEPLKKGFEIEFELIEYIDITKENKNIVIDIDRENIKRIKIVPYDPLHYDTVEEEYKQEIEINIYEKKNTDLCIKEPILPVFLHNNILKSVKKTAKNTYTVSNFSTEEFEDIKKDYHFIGNIGINCAYSDVDNWKEKDSPILKEIYGEEIEFETDDKLNLNGIRFHRNGKQIDRHSPPNLPRGDFLKRRINTNTRIRINSDSNSDKFIPPLIKKTGLDIESVDPNLMNTIDWIIERFREKMHIKIIEIKNNSSISNDDDDAQSKHSELTNDMDMVSEKEESLKSVITLKSDTTQKSGTKQKFKLLVKPSKVKSKVKPEVNTEIVSISTTSQNEEIIDSMEEPPNINSIVETKKSYQAEYLIKKDFIVMLNFWFSKTENQYFHDSLTETLNDLMRCLQFYSPYIYEYRIKNDSLEDKVNCVIEYYNKRYENETERVEYGANFFRAHEQYVTSQYNNQF